MQTARTTIRSDHGYPNRCTLRYVDDLGTPVERNFFAPVGGGSVREDWTQPRQVCEYLARMGATLIWDPTRDATLAALIRRERRAAQDADRRFWARFRAAW